MARSRPVLTDVGMIEPPGPVTRGLTPTEKLGWVMQGLMMMVVGAGDGGDVGSMDGGADESPGEPQPAAGLVRRLLTGRAKTTYTCCACGFVSRAARVVSSLATRTGSRICTWRCRRRSPGR